MTVYDLSGRYKGIINCDVTHPVRRLWGMIWVCGKMRLSAIEKEQVERAG